VEKPGLTQSPVSAYLICQAKGRVSETGQWVSPTAVSGAAILTQGLGVAEARLKTSPYGRRRQESEIWEAITVQDLGTWTVREMWRSSRLPVLLAPVAVSRTRRKNP